MASSDHTARFAARSKRAARLARWRFRLTAWAVVLAALGLSIRYDRCLSAWAQEHLRVLPNHVLVSFRWMSWTRVGYPMTASVRISSAVFG